MICEYLDDTLLPRLHPGDALKRAQHRAWMEFGSSVLNTIAAFYNAPDAAALESRRAELAGKFAQLEAVLPAQGPYFSGTGFSIVDAVFGPVFRYFDVLERAGETGFFEKLPKVRAWRADLAARPSIHQAVGSAYAKSCTTSSWPAALNSRAASRTMKIEPDAIKRMAAIGQKRTYDCLTAKQTRTWSSNRVDCKAGAATL